MISENMRKVDRKRVFGSLIQPGSRLAMKIADDRFSTYHASRVEDLSSNRITVSGPTHRGQLLKVPEGSEIIIRSSSERGIYEFRAKTLEIRREPFYQLVIEIPRNEPILHVQRRSFVRLGHIAEAEYKPVLLLNGTPPARRGWLDTFVKNLSATGVCLITDTLVPVNSRVKFRLPFLSNCDLQELEGEVCWVRRTPSRRGDLRAEHGVRFTDLRTEERERLVKYVLHQERRQIRINS